MDEATLAALYGDMSEATLQVNCERALGQAGWLYYHTHDSRRSEEGFVDLVAVRGARVLWRELKKQKGKITPKQLEWGAALVAAGEDYRIWRPYDWGRGIIMEEIK